MMRNPPHPYTTHVDWDVPPPPAKLVLRWDYARTLLRRNNSPDIGFHYSVNPYRGCTHACAYCYARRTHEHLDLGAGEDFDRILYVKQGAAGLLREAFDKPSWKGDVVVMSGVTDPYQPVERRLQVTRTLLEVFAAYRNPVRILTRSPLVVRDIDLLAPLATHGAVRVQVSIPVGDPGLCTALEPGAPPPRARFRAMRALADAGIPVGVSLAPVLPGISESVIPQTLIAAADAGASWAIMSLLRLPGAVEQVFYDRLAQKLPRRVEPLRARLDALRAAQVGPGRADTRFGERLRGAGPAWQATQDLFDLWCRKLGLHASQPESGGPSPFRRPGHGLQLGLF